MPTQRMLLAIAIAVAFWWLGVRPANAQVITWSDMEMRLADCDIIQATVQRNAVNLSQIELAIDLSSRIVSWKGVGIFPKSGGYYEVGTPGNVRYDSMRLSAGEVMGAKSIVLGKAKFAGLHQAVYEIHDLSHLQPGDRVTFWWAQDTCPYFGGRIEPAAVPDWVKPGSVTTVTLPIRAGATWYPDQLLDIHFDSKLGIPAHTIRQIVQRDGQLDLTVEFTAPKTIGANIFFDVWINQRGGTESYSLLRKYIRVDNMAPTPPPPPPKPKLVTVPDVRNMTLEQGRRTLAAVGLGVAPQGRDPSVPESEQTIYAQMPGMGSQVLENVKINVSLGMQSYVNPNGYSELAFINCQSTTLLLYEYDPAHDGWQKRADIPPMWSDNLCPANNPLVRHSLTDGTWQFYVVLDPVRCSSKQPDDPACWVADMWIRGDSNGPIAPVVNL